MLELCADATDSVAMSSPEDASQDPLAHAAARLDGAMARVERLAARLRARAEAAEAAAADARNADTDRALLAEALDAARSREAALSDAAQSASDALDRAIGDLREWAQEE